MMADTIKRRGNSIIWWLNQDRRRVWEMDPIGGAVVQFRDETYKRHRGRFAWVCRPEEAWSNPEFAGPHPWGLMTECPEVPSLDSPPAPARG